MCYIVWYILLGRVEGEIIRSNKVRSSLTEFDLTADNGTQKFTKKTSLQDSKQCIAVAFHWTL